MASYINDIPIMEGYVSIPRMGAWNADITILTKNQTGDISRVPVDGDSVTLTIDGSTFLGTVTYTNEKVWGRAVMRIVAGNGAFASRFPVLSWAGPQVKVILNGLLTAAGEPSASGLSDQGVLLQQLPSWTAFADVTLAHNLTRLANVVDRSWRIDLATGLVLFVEDTFSATVSLPTNIFIVNDVNQSGATLYEATTMDVLPLPGTLDADGERIEEVALFIHENVTQFELRHRQFSDMVARDKGSELRGLYAATVSVQNSDKSLDVVPDDDRIATKVGNVNILGGSSTTWNVTTGTRCTLAFRDGDPSLPVIVALDGWWSGDSLSNVAYGDPSLAQFLARSDKVDLDFTATETMATAIVAWVSAWQAQALINAPIEGAAMTTPTSTLVTALSTFIAAVLPTACGRVKSD